MHPVHMIECTALGAGLRRVACLCVMDDCRSSGTQRRDVMLTFSSASLLLVRMSISRLGIDSAKEAAQLSAENEMAASIHASHHQPSWVLHQTSRSVRRTF